eukprot:4422105-Prorocentrum_lima.AAC.1
MLSTRIAIQYPHGARVVSRVPHCLIEGYDDVTKMLLPDTCQASVYQEVIQYRLLPMKHKRPRK